MNLISVTPTISTGAYTAGDAVGGKLTFTGVPTSGLLMSVIIIDNDAEGAATDLVLFDRDFTAVADNAAFNVTATEEGRLVTVVNLTTWDALGAGTKIAVLENLNIPFILNEADTEKRGKLFGQLVTRGTPTYTATDDIIVKIGVVPN